MAHRYIGRNIYELRKKRGWSQSDLARKLDKKTSTISSYETDSKTPSVDTIIAMSELFGVSIDELIYGENAEVLSTKHLAAEQKRAVADLLQGLTLLWRERGSAFDKTLGGGAKARCCGLIAGVDAVQRRQRQGRACTDTIAFASYKGNGAVKSKYQNF